ncbi:MAG: DUF4376 domain-containing protein [Paracoccaceae bacterium]|nr:DUF4376 domain-containing protein [Paracoccaceae bacterium]
MIITLFDRATGQISDTMTVPDVATADLQLTAGQAWVEGHHAHDQVYLVDGRAVAYPPKPGPWATFDFAGAVWVDPRGPDEVAAQAAADLASMRAAVTAERDRRLATTFAFNGARFNSDAPSLARITGAAALAGFAIGAGAKPGDLFWHGGDQPFTWISSDNGLITMDAPTVFAFGRAAASNETAHVFAARTIKDMAPIPDDFTDDKYWPKG